MGEAQAAARYQQQVEELCAASLRALSGLPTLHFRGRRLYRDGVLLPRFAPHLHPASETDDFSSFRGAADGMALRLLLSDQALHEALAPRAPVQALLFDMLEQTRVESLAPPAMPGIARNLQHRHARWLEGFHHSGMTETERGLLLFTVAQVCRMRVTGEPALDDTEDMMEATRAALSPLIGHELAGLRRNRHDQAAYGQHARALAEKVADLLEQEEGGPAQRQSTALEQDASLAAFGLLPDGSSDAPEALPTANTGRSLVLEKQQGRYRVFTTAYDTELRAGSRVRPAQLREYREQLDRIVGGHKINIPRLARELKTLLAWPAEDGWLHGQEEGQVDGRRLAQLLASPLERRLFRTEHRVPKADCVVSFLIDCSGSMKQHIETIAMLVDVFCRALALAGARSEVLGYTTGAWNGGRAQRDWQRAGRPPHPGRLNERCHLVFKDSATPWQRARGDLAALLKADLFRESVDGEAVDWACSRLREKEARRRLLIVLSDGCPMDRATELANDAFYLDNHLRDVVARQEQDGSVEILGLGVGLDLSPYYSWCQALDLAALSGNALCREVLGALANRRRR